MCTPSITNGSGAKEKMKQRVYGSDFIVSCFFFLVCLLSIFSGSAEAYQNFTVGDSLGWYDQLENPNVNYQKWVSGKTFSLGDFLIFNTDNNHSVIQTSNATIYKLCDDSSVAANATVEWSVADPSAASPHSVTVQVPLTKQGMTYFYSDDYDGEQCMNGQKFQINVTYGKGLPASMQDAAPGPDNPDAENEDSAPDTIINTNFNNPKVNGADGKDDGGDGGKKNSGSERMRSNWIWREGLFGIIVFLGVLV